MRSGDDLAADLLRRGGPLRIKARGASMVPFLWDGDVVLVVPSTGTEVGVGDVICYETSPGRLFLHRVIERRRERFVAKGDALTLQIRITGRREGSVAIIEVSDTGPGVPAKAREHLFEAFQTSGRPGGSGLGLAIAAELVRAHGGDIHLVEGTIGATFRIVIPDRPVELLTIRNERQRA